MKNHEIFFANLFGFLYVKKKMFKSVNKRKSCSCVKLNHAHIICMKDIVVNVSQNTLNFEN